MNRTYSAHVVETMPSATDHVSWVQTRLGRMASAKLTSSDQVCLQIVGTSPINVEDAYSTCLRLIRVLNALGDQWADPKPGEADVDCEAQDLREPSKGIQI